MSCDNCMKHRPGIFNDGHFKCPECDQIYVLAGVGPGNYWERIEDQIEEIEGHYKNWGKTEGSKKRVGWLKSLIP